MNDDDKAEALTCTWAFGIMLAFVVLLVVIVAMILKGVSRG